MWVIHIRMDGHIMFEYESTINRITGKMVQHNPIQSHILSQPVTACVFRIISWKITTDDDDGLYLRFVFFFCQGHSSKAKPLAIWSSALSCGQLRPTAKWLFNRSSMQTDIYVRHHPVPHSSHE